MIFNINNYVEIKLTQYGKDILKEKEDKIFTEYPSLKEYLYKYKVNNRGYLKLQLWEVMNKALDCKEVVELPDNIHAVEEFESWLNIP